jgi:hypothetical protein
VDDDGQISGYITKLKKKRDPFYDGTAAAP